MTDEERRLAELLQQAVPQPPRRITAADIAAQLARRPAVARYRFSPWLPALAAASVLLVIAASSVWLISGHSAPSAPTAQSSSAATSTSATTTASSASTSPTRTVSSASTSPSRPPSSSGSTAPSRTATRTGPKPTPSTPSAFRSGTIGAFDARLLNSAPIGPILVSGAGAVYGIEGQTVIDRFDPSSGAITAQAPADSNANWPPLVTPRALWQTAVAPGAVTIRRLDPRNLQQVGSTQIAAQTPSSTGPQWTPALAANADYSALLLGNANQIYELNPGSGAVERQVSVPGLVGALAVSPDGSKLYAGLNVAGSGTARLLVLDIRHGLRTLDDTALDNGPVAGLLATSGGLWITYVTGRENNIRFAPLTDLVHTREAIPGGGGLPATATVAGGKVFLSGIYTIACADPMTGAVLAQAQQMGELGLTHYFGSAQLVAGHYLASFQTNYSDDRGLAILTPPAACR